MENDLMVHGLISNVKKRLPKVFQEKTGYLQETLTVTMRALKKKDKG